MQEQQNRHSAWEQDTTANGTGGESMRISTVRHLSRTLGEVLASTTTSREESQRLLKDILGSEPKISDFVRLLNTTVDAIYSASSLDSATASVTKAWSTIADKALWSRLTLLSSLVAMTKETCTDMLQELLSQKPGQDKNRSGDGTMETVFGNYGEVQKISVVLKRGRFAAELHDAINQATETYQADKQGAFSCQPFMLPEVAQVKLYIVDNKQQQLHEFKASSANFERAYLEATLKYAAVWYADRVRKELPSDPKSPP
jgi:excinuclease UvrABC ATPase subunit